MFIDVCFPKKEEKKFIETAKKLGVSKICFSYDKKTFLVEDKKRTELPIVFRSEKDPLVKSKKNILVIDGFNRAAFNRPIYDLSQVYIKNIKESYSAVMFRCIFEINKTPDFIEKIRFYARLLKKYGVPIIIASCADSPWKMRSKEELGSLAKLFLLGDSSINALYEVISSASFL